MSSSWNLSDPKYTNKCVCVSVFSQQGHSLSCLKRNNAFLLSCSSWCLEGLCTVWVKATVQRACNYHHQRKDRLSHNTLVFHRGCTSHSVITVPLYALDWERLISRWDWNDPCLLIQWKRDRFYWMILDDSGDIDLNVPGICSCCYSYLRVVQSLLWCIGAGPGRHRWCQSRLCTSDPPHQRRSAESLWCRSLSGSPERQRER